MIETVLGPVPASTWGPTSMHDHLVSDSSRLARPGTEPAPELDRVTARNIRYLRRNMLASADNLRLDDPALIARELGATARAGQHGVVEASSWGLGPHHTHLPDISRASGVAVVSAYGAYIPRTLPSWIARMSESELRQHLSDALTVAIPGTTFRAGILGIMGTTADFPPREQAMLRAAARAALSAGAAVTVRLEETARRGLDVLAVVTTEGLPADRVVFTNADEYMDASYWDDLADAGAVLEMCFGTEAVHEGRIDNPQDADRLDFFVDFVMTHSHSRHVLGQSIWTKTQLAVFGGRGYGYLAAEIVPELHRRGIAGARIDEMWIDEPRRLLDRQHVRNSYVDAN
ncbi:phosphotriesterase-related protein [Microbacterium endophyticum]|uniref:Phosphotriesterase-related protein n=1 Tax=Microbacterium endophyticum TaxID=1526412 RepID=A0A7W4YMD3_9MICO|nr:phosphotriesterase [Microbacterium endophyticum]MBB2975384.1 phosphotriesterase-related protein [Microbacterium endophyticum]NIK35597.1 phosphotriesterase-related protein [Microbacterium endophyticum]